MKNTLILINLILLVTNVSAQNFEWAQNIGGLSSECGNDVVLDDNGNMYLTGLFTGTVDFDPGIGVYNLISNGVNGIFIAKLNSSGDLLWVKQFVDIGYNGFIATIELDQNGDLLIAGRFEGVVDFDLGINYFTLTSNGDYDGFITKLDTSGNFVWAKQIGGAGLVNVNSIKQDSLGNIYVLGLFDEWADFDPGINTYNLASYTGGADVFISKLDTAGNFIWAKKIGGFSSDGGFRMAIDNNGDLLITGNFGGGVDFDPGINYFPLTSNGSSDIFIVKLSLNGNFIWAKSIGGSSSSDFVISISVDSLNNLYLAGRFDGTVDFDPGIGVDNLISNGVSDIFIAKLNTNGGFVWAKKIGGQVGESATQMIIDKTENIYITGSFEGLVDFDPSNSTYYLTSNGSSDIFIAKLNNNGILQWAKKIGGNGGDQGKSIAVNNYGYLHLTGCFSNIVDFDITNNTYNLTSNGLVDIFNLKLDIITYGCTDTNSCTYNYLATVDDGSCIYNDTTIDQQVACDNYTWLDGFTYTSTNNTASYVLTNVNGCDSIVNLDLIIYQATATFDTIITCDSIIWNNAIYDSSGVYYYDGTFSNNFSMNFDSNYIDVGNSTILSPDSFLTLMAWVKPIQNKDFQMIATKGSHINMFNRTYQLMGPQDNGLWKASLHIDGAGEQYLNSQQTAVLNQWTHTAITYDGTIIKYYINGVLNDSVLTSGPIYQTTNPLYFGDQLYYTPSDFKFYGNVDDVQIWSKALGQEEILNYMTCTPFTNEIKLIGYWNFENGSGNIANDQSTHGNNGLLIDAPIWDYDTPTQYCSITNLNGCDSTVILNLTINNSNSSTDSLINCDSYLWNGITYVQSGTYDSTFTNTNGCDSVATLNLTITGLPVATIVQNGIDLEVTTAIYYTWSTTETTQTITPATNGTYWCIVADINGCISDTSFFEVTNVVSSVGEILSDKILIYPNPAKDYIVIETEYIITKIKVIDAQAKFVDVQVKGKTIDVSGIANGQYFVEVYTDKGLVRKQFVKQ